jgi:hypothetical protein
MGKILENPVEVSKNYINRGGAVVKVTKVKNGGDLNHEFYAQVKVIKPGDNFDLDDEYAVNAYGGYNAADDPDEVAYDLMSSEEEAAVKAAAAVKDELSLLRQGIESQERQRDNDKSTISALNAQLVASNQRFYALDTDYKVVVEELGRTSIQINELFNTKRATEEREALLTAQREVMQNEIDQFQGILDKLQAMHGATESDLGREKSHVDALMKLVEVATNAFSKLGKSHE